jgi:outer membrane protein assembly factor BamB
MFCLSIFRPRAGARAHGIYRAASLIVPICLLLASGGGQKAWGQTNWTRWRGPEGTGHTQQKLPVEWDVEDVAWRVELPGRGQSSPIVWEDRIFLTSSEEGGGQRVILCLDRADGRMLWKQVAWTGDPEKVHEMNPWASATCATDGERVVAFFGHGGLHCYDVEGNKLWSRELGDFAGPWGTAASPIIVDDLVVQNCDADDSSFLIALNKETGAEVWRTERQAIRGWSTPIVIEHDGRREIVLNGHYGVNAYDPATGKELWFCKGSIGRGTPTVAPYRDLLISVCGRTGGEMIAVRMGGEGDVSQSHEVWRVPRRGSRDLPSPTVVDKYLMVISFRPGLGSCYDAASGKQLWKSRLSGEFCASPIVSNGLLYVPNEDGETFVIRPGDSLQIVARNRVNSTPDEIFRASLAPSDGQLLLRSDRALYCIGRRSTPASE